MKKSGFFRREQNISPKIWPKRPVRIVVWAEGEIRGYERGQESGKQCKAVPTLRKQADSVYTEPACFMLVGALPQSPQKIKAVLRLVRETFGGSLPAFIAAFTSRKKPSQVEIAEIQRILDLSRKEEWMERLKQAA